MIMYTVYVHKNKINGKCYVGITSKVPEKRWRNGLGYYGQGFYSAIQKYGWDSFEHIVLEMNLTKEEAAKKEIEYINYYNSYANGYNCSTGGEDTSFNHLTEETRRKISIANKGKLSGSKNPMYGKSMIERMGNEERYKEWKKNASAVLKKAYEGSRMPVICLNTMEVFESQTSAAKAFGIPQQTLSRILDDQYCTGKWVDADQRYLHFEYFEEGKEYSLNGWIIQHAKRPIICLTNGEIYVSSGEASRCTGVSMSCVLGICKGTKKITKGYDFMFYKDYLKFGIVKHETPKENRKRVYCVTTGEYFESIGAASKKYSLNSGNICSCCSGKTKYAGKDKQGLPLVWEYCS